MAAWTTVALLCIAACVAEAEPHKAHTSSICDTTLNSTNKVQCYCTKDQHDIVRSADCYITVDNVTPDDKSWEEFAILKHARRITFTNTRGITMKYIPTKALKETNGPSKIDIKYSSIQRVDAFAFANLTTLQELVLRDNQIEILEQNAFAHHSGLTAISLDKNNIFEINRDVFIDLPSLQKLFLTGNKITTLHDRAFVNLANLKELEIDGNSIFSLNSETFSGLTNLEKLDLSSNSLEVIGDNTFLPLKNLRSLSLESNNIQMLDDKAFNGLGKLQSLSLARNKLSNIDSVKIFEGLEALVSLSLNENLLRELKAEVMAPILGNFYGIAGSLDVEGNSFPCDCRLDWFISLMNKTQNNRLKIAIENLKCLPEPEIRELYMKSEDPDKNTAQVLDDDEPQTQNADYEYYDVSQLNGRLFYIDMRYLLNCTSRLGTSKIQPNMAQIEKTVTETAAKETTLPTKPEIKAKKVTNHGVLDLSVDESTIKGIDEGKNGLDENSDVRGNPTPIVYTTTRLATVSAKPSADMKPYDEQEMAADEAKPDQLTTHRSRHDAFKTNDARRNVGSVTLLSAIILVFRQHF